MPSPCASAGTMYRFSVYLFSLYLFSVGSGSLAITSPVEDEAAIDGEQLAGDETCPLPEQKHYDPGHILGMLGALHGAARHIELPAFLRHVFGRLDQHQAGRNGVDGDVVGAELARQRA